METTPQAHELAAAHPVRATRPASLEDQLAQAMVACGITVTPAMQEAQAEVGRRVRARIAQRLAISGRH